jgi:hypothetical protein
MVFAFVFFAIASKWNPPGWSLIAAGLACWVLAEILGGVLRLGFAH